MIYYFVTESRAGAIRSFLGNWGKRLAPRIKVVTYDRLLAGCERLPERGGAYIFSNLGTVSMLSPQVQSTICDWHDRLVERHGAERVHNDPARSLLRYDLLRRLHERGINAFNAYRVTDPDARMRFPAIVRHQMKSLYEQPQLANDAAQYEALLRGIRWLGYSLDDFIAVEYCDTADASGVYRKYGAFVVGDRIIPRHIYFSRDWHIRWDDLTDLAMVEEELQFLHTNPHAGTLLQCARLAGISYGRFDYGLLDGRPQIWECNTNAGVVFPPEDDLPERLQVHLKFVDMYAAAMIALDDET